MIRGALVLLLAAVMVAGCGDRSTQPPQGRYLVYTKDWALWIAHVDGSHARLLVPNATYYGTPSPDGRWVVYEKCLASKAACQSGPAPSAVFLIPSGGGKSRLLARSVDYPVWSPRSDRIVALRRDAELISLDLAGKARVLDAGELIPGSFSPDGSQLAYSKRRPNTKCGSDLMVVRLTDGQKRRLTQGISPVWDRHWIAFSLDTPNCSYARRIWRVRPDGSDLRPVTGPPPREQGIYGFVPIDWAPGERVLFAGLIDEWGYEAISLDVSTGKFKKLGGYALALSRDGRTALLTSGGAECPFTITSYTIATGRRHFLARGCIVDAEWNR